MAEKTLIWAQTKDGTIAVNNAIPWHQHADMTLFKEKTQGEVVVMGRNTMASLHGRALPERINLVLTHDDTLVVPEGFQRVLSLAEAEAIADVLHKKLQVIGGKAIYDSYLPEADQLIVTYLQSDLDGNVKMPDVDTTIWQGTVIDSGQADSQNDYAYKIVAYNRK